MKYQIFKKDLERILKLLEYKFAEGKISFKEYKKGIEFVEKIIQA